MRMADGVDVGPEPVDQKMHTQLGGRLSQAADALAFEIDDDQIVWIHHRLAHRSGRYEDAVRTEPHGNVSIRGCHVAAIVSPAAHGANVATVFHFRLYGPVSD